MNEDKEEILAAIKSLKKEVKPQKVKEPKKVVRVFSADKSKDWGFLLSFLNKPGEITFVSENGQDRENRLPINLFVIVAVSTRIVDAIEKFTVFKKEINEEAIIVFMRIGSEEAKFSSLGTVLGSGLTINNIYIPIQLEFLYFKNDLAQDCRMNEDNGSKLISSIHQYIEALKKMHRIVVY